MAAERNFYIRQGDTFTHTLIVWDGVDPVTQEKIPLDLEGLGAVVTSEIREAGETPLSDSGELLATFDAASPVENTVVLSLDSETSATIPPGKHWYDVQVVTSSKQTFLSGTVIVLPAVAV